MIPNIPRCGLASIEREDRKSAAFISPTARTLYETADLLMRKDGMVGGPMRFAEDLMRRRNGEGVTWTFYESLVTNPQKVMERIERDCQLEPFDWDFDNVVNVATDLDALYRGKFPHKGSGKISPDQASWRDTLSPEIASLVAGAYPYFMRTFGYDT